MNLQEKLTQLAVEREQLVVALHENHKQKHPKVEFNLKTIIIELYSF